MVATVQLIPLHVYKREAYTAIVSTDVCNVTSLKVRPITITQYMRMLTTLLC